MPWAFCRSTVRQNRALSGAESITGRLGDFQASRCSGCVDPEVSVVKTVPRDSGSQRLQHRISVSQRCTDAIRFAGWAQTVLQRETGRIAVLVCGSNRDQQLLADTILPNKAAAIPAVFETFWLRCQMGKASLFGYSVVNFPTFLFRKLNFFKTFSFFWRILLTYSLYGLHS